MPSAEPLFALVDCNNFYASCQRVFEPGLRGKPVVVLSNNDGCVIARSEEAKALGIPMGAPIFKWQKFVRQHGVAVRSANFELYGDLSGRVVDSLRALCPEVELYSIDESFLRLDGGPQADPLPLARAIREKVVRWTGIPVSVGIASTKTLAKLANRLAKKLIRLEGVLHLRPEWVGAALARTKASEVWGIGRRLSKRLERVGAHTAAQVAALPDAWLRRELGVVGLRLALELRGTACAALEELPPDKKQIMTGRSFGHKVSALAELEEAVSTFVAWNGQKLRAQGSTASMLWLSLHTDPFDWNPPAHRVAQAGFAPTDQTHVLTGHALRALRSLHEPGTSYKKATVGLSAIHPAANRQGELFAATPPRHEGLWQVVDQINGKFGKDALRTAAAGFGRDWWMNQHHLSPSYTTRWDQLLEVGD